MFIINLFSRITQRPILIFRSLFRILSLIRKRYIKINAFLHGGKVELDSRIYIDNKVSFQGQGKLMIASGVKLGFWLAGSSSLPILFQPRDKNAIIKIGENSVIGNGSELIAKKLINIGSNCLLGPQTIIYDSDFHNINPNNRKGGISNPVVIEDNVWIGSNVIILKGVTIGRDSVIGAGSLVSKNVPCGSIIGGNPMKIIGSVYQNK